ncbi:MAG TPA: carboxypeptidase-like regulatory domain-containing protein [Terriglobales bacterium]|nr:carboxypeptidase-like regulatory domain-containing protein [Terriglobales bacterium]
MSQAIILAQIVVALFIAGVGTGGKVQGTVRDPAGRPVQGAHVLALDIMHPHTGPGLEANSGPDGRFDLPSTEPPGTKLAFWAGKPGDFYPEMAGAFYTSRAFEI